MTRLTRGAFAFPGTAIDFKTGTWRVQRPVHHHSAAPCHHACPAGEDAQAYLARIEEGDFRRAWQVLVEINPMPAITGRVCHHPCEDACNRGHMDEPIAIHAVERYLGDLAIHEQWEYPVRPAPAQAPRVAVVGAGPAGLANAYHMVKLGYNVTLFDALPETGGTLRTGIPTYRLPREVIDNESGRILALGIEFLPRMQLGRDADLRELQADYAAVFLAPGTMKGRRWSVGDVTPKDLHQGLDLIKDWLSVGSVPPMRSAAVIGGGNTAVDAARILKHAGVPEVHIITHNGLPGPGAVPGDVMRAIPREIDQAQEEGVRIHEHRGIRRLIMRGGQVIGVEMVHMKKLRDANDRLQRVAFEGTETVLHVDQVIPAIGLEVEAAGFEWVLGTDHYLPVDRHLALRGHPGLWAGGDAVGSGRGTVTAAIGDGRRAAEAMAAHIGQRQLREESDRRVATFEELNVQYFETALRVREPILPLEERMEEGKEIVGSVQKTDALREARRCFSCGNCMACDNCWTLCPDSAVLKNPGAEKEGDRYVFDYDYCKGCGVCASECPCGFIDMIDEV